MTTYHLGIDPGLSGALAFYDPAQDILAVTDMPVLETKSGGKVKRHIDFYELARVFDLYDGKIRRAVIEAVHSMPGQGVASSFKFGVTFGAAQAMVAAHFVPVLLAPPMLWKRAMGLDADKSRSRMRASQILPRHCHLWSRAKDDGRAEAALLAVFGSRQP